jgi:hypothetical protein
MSQVMKAFMGVFMVLFLMTTSTGVLGAFYQILYAQNSHAVMVDELENSDFAKSVMEACFETAEREEYRLQMSLYSSSKDTCICTSKEELPAETEDITMVEVLLFYDIEIAFFEIAKEQQLFGYAR